MREEDPRDDVKMDANRLIMEVYKRPALWNQRHLSYHNRDVTNRIWMEIANIFRLPKPVLKAKWKGLRDTFRAELKKETVYQKSKYKRNRPLWIHFKSLHFLKEQMLPRPPIWERTTRASARNDMHRRDDDCDQSQLQNGIDTEAEDSFADHLLCSSINNIDGNRNRSAKGEGSGQTTVKAEPLEECYEDLDFQATSGDQNMDNLSNNEMMLQNISPEQVLLGGGGGGGCDSDSSIGMTVDPLDGQRCDDNYYFLMSLLPHIRTLPPERRMFLRIQMQELVYKEVYTKGANNSNDDGKEPNNESEAAP